MATNCEEGNLSEVGKAELLPKIVMEKDTGIDLEIFFWDHFYRFVNSICNVKNRIQLRNGDQSFYCIIKAG